MNEGNQPSCSCFVCVRVSRIDRIEYKILLLSHFWKTVLTVLGTRRSDPPGLVCRATPNRVVGPVPSGVCFRGSSRAPLVLRFLNVCFLRMSLTNFLGRSSVLIVDCLLVAFFFATRKRERDIYIIIRLVSSLMNQRQTCRVLPQL